MIVKRQKVSKADLEKAEKDGVIQRKPNGKWGIISRQAKEWWNADYETKENAQKSLAAYQSQKNYSGIFESIKNQFRRQTNPPKPISTPAPLDRSELAVRQGYMESGFNSRAGKKFKGIFQIGQGTLDDYNKANKTSYSLDDMNDAKTNTQVRNWNMEKQEKLARRDRPGITDSVAFGQAMAAHNFGRNNTRKALNQADKDGVSTKDGWGWLNYFPKETQDYINFGLRGKNNSLHRNNIAYGVSKVINAPTVNVIKNSTK